MVILVRDGHPGQPLVNLVSQAVELRSTALGSVLLRVEQADPQAGGPGVLDLRFRPLPPRCILPVPGVPENRRAYSRISSHPARLLPAKCRSKDSRSVSMIPVATDSQCPSISAPTGPRSRTALMKTRAGAVTSSKSASIGHARAPLPSSDPASSLAAPPSSAPHGIRPS